MSRPYYVDIDRHGAVAILNMDDPATLNAMSLDMVDDMMAALDACIPDARCIVITGRGRGFCSGAYLTDADPDMPDYDAGAALDTHYNPLMLKLMKSPIPLVTAVNGPSAGVGSSIALAGDMVIAASTAYFLQPFRHIGLVPDTGSTGMLVRSIGRVRALELMLLGERLSAESALGLGLVNRVVPPESLLSCALDIARRIATGPTRSLGMTRQLAWASLEDGRDAMLAEERRLQREAGRTADHREGLAAFKSKRPARFEGR